MSITKTLRVVALALVAALVPATALAGTPEASAAPAAMKMQKAQTSPRVMKAHVIKVKAVKTGKATRAPLAVKKVRRITR